MFKTNDSRLKVILKTRNSENINKKINKCQTQSNNGINEDDTEKKIKEINPFFAHLDIFNNTQNPKEITEATKLSKNEEFELESYDSVNTFQVLQVPISCREIFNKYAVPMYDRNERKIIQKMSVDSFRQFFLEEMSQNISSYRASLILGRTHNESSNNNILPLLEVQERWLRNRIFRPLINVADFQKLIQYCPPFTIANIKGKLQSSNEKLNKYYISCATLKPEMCENLQELIKQINHQVFQHSVHCLQLPIEKIDDRIIIRLKSNCPEKERELLSSEEKQNKKWNNIEMNSQVKDKIDNLINPKKFYRSHEMNKSNFISLQDFLEEYSKYTKLPAQILLFISKELFPKKIIERLFEMIQEHLLHKLYCFDEEPQGYLSLKKLKFCNADDKVPDLKKILSKVITLYTWQERQKLFVPCLASIKDIKKHQQDMTLREEKNNLFLTIRSSDFVEQLSDPEKVYARLRDDFTLFEGLDRDIAKITGKHIVIVIDDFKINEQISANQIDNHPSNRLISSPEIFWSEMIRMGVQGLLRNCRIVDGFFTQLDNNCGFVLKPSQLQRGELYRLVKDIPKKDNLSKTSFFASFRILWHNIPCESSKIVIKIFGHLNDLDRFETAIVKVHQSFNDQFQFNIRLPETAMISFEVFTNESEEEPFAHCFLPVIGLKIGIRSLHLNVNNKSSIGKGNICENICGNDHLKGNQFRNDLIDNKGLRYKKEKRNTIDKKESQIFYRKDQWASTDTYRLIIMLQCVIITGYTLYVEC